MGSDILYKLWVIVIVRAKMARKEEKS